MNGNGGLIEDKIVFPGNEIHDFFLFHPDGMFEPTFEELLTGEIRADWEDESDDNEEMEIGGTWEPLPLETQPQKLKIELSINLNVSINGEAVSIQINNGLDSLGGGQDACINKRETTRPIDNAQNEFGGGVLRI